MLRQTMFASAGRLALAIGVLAAGAARAGTGADPAPGSTAVSGVTVQGEVVVTAPMSLPVGTPYSGSTITAQDVRDLPLNPTLNLETMLQDQPSVFAYSNGPLGVGTNIFYRGFNSGQFAQTYENIGLTDIFNGGVTGSADTVNKVLLLPRNVDSVELFRGINNPDVNSYDSLGGTINFLPRQPSANAGGLIGGAYGSFHTFDTYAEYNTGDIDGVRQLITYDHAESDGWIPHTKDRNTNVFYSASWDGANNDHVSLILVYNDNNGHTPFQMPTPLLQANGGYYQYPPSVAFEQDKDAQYLAILDVRTPVSSAIVLDNKFFAGDNNYRRVSYANPADYESKTQPYELYSQGSSYFWKPSYGYINGPTYDPLTVFGSATAGDDYHLYDYSTWGLGWQPSLTIALPANFVTLGGNITLARLHSAEYWYGSTPVPSVLGYDDTWDEHDERVFGSLYIQDDIHLLHDHLTITPGVKYIYAYTSDADSVGIYYPYGASLDQHNHFVSPTLGVNYKVDDHLGLFAAFGENFKLPDISALYDSIPGNDTSTNAQIPPTAPTVKPEYVRDYEFGARYQRAGLSAEIDVYREDFTNIFVDQYDSYSDATYVTNGGKARYQGVEIRLMDDFRLSSYGDIRAFANYAYNQAYYRTRFEADSIGAGETESDGLVTPGEEMPDVPTQLVSFGATWTWDQFRATLRGRYIGPQETVDYNTGVPDGVKIEGYFLMDIGLAKTFRMPDARFAKTVKLSVDLNNVLNKYYYNYADTSFKENYFGTLTEFASPGAPRNVMGRIEIGF